MNCYIRSYFVGVRKNDIPSLPRKYARFLTPIGVEAVQIALALSPRPDDPDRVGIFTATGPSRFDPGHLGRRLAAIDPEKPFWKNTLAYVDPFSLLKTMSASVLSILSIVLPARGTSAHFCEDSLGGLLALQEARDAIERNTVSLAIVLAFDDLTSPHAKSELFHANRQGKEKQIACVLLTNKIDNALAKFSHLVVTHKKQSNTLPVGGAAGLAAFLKTLQKKRFKKSACSKEQKTSMIRLKIMADRGEADIQVTPETSFFL